MKYYYNLILISLFLTSSVFITSSFLISFAESSEITDDKENKITIKTKISLDNVKNIEKFDTIKIVGYLNGEIQLRYVDLNNISVNQKENRLDLDLKFNKINGLSDIIIDDEYFVCAYFINKSFDENDISIIDSKIPFYDCDEGNIGNIDKDSVHLFYTLKKYNKSFNYYNSNIEKIKQDSKLDNVKIVIKVPIYDDKDIEHMYVVAMVRGEYKIKTIDVEKELDKEDSKSTDKMIHVPFVFERETELGSLQIGDMFFGCATSDDFPNQNSDCEKRLLHKLEKANKLCARKDNSC